jgi:hypothetical protein
MTLAQAPVGLRTAARRAFGQLSSAQGPSLQKAKLTAPDAAVGDYFGDSVAVSGSTAVIGAEYKDSGKGAAYVFVRSGMVWSEQAELKAADGVAGDLFGYSVAASGSTAVVGAVGRNGSIGAAYVFVRSGTTWSQQATLTASDGASGDSFANSVAVSGSTVVVGASNKNFSTGAAYAFVRSGTTWSQQAELTASDGGAFDGFGYSVAVSASNAVVGAYGHNSSAGAAYVFVRSLRLLGGNLCVHRVGGRVLQELVHWSGIRVRSFGGALVRAGQAHSARRCLGRLLRLLGGPL